MTKSVRNIIFAGAALAAAAIPATHADGVSYTENGGVLSSQVTVPACTCQQVLTVYGAEGAGSNHGPLVYWDKPGGFSQHVSGPVDAGTYQFYLSILSDAYGDGGTSVIVFNW